MKESKCIPTLNQKGYQMSVPTPLLDQWIQGYDGKHPLMDIGCAYGINTYEALAKSIPTIAVHRDKRHLKILQSNMDDKRRKLFITQEGSLPDKINVQNNSLSGILLSEVLHNIKGEDIRISLKTIHSKLVPGGKLVLTALQIYMFENKNERIVVKFFEDREKGDKWPGVTNIDNEVVSQLRNASKSQNVDFNEIGTGKPIFLHFFVLPQIVNELEIVGFEIDEAREGTHPGYPSGDSKIPKSNLQLVAKKLLKLLTDEQTTYVNLKNV